MGIIKGFSDAFHGTLADQWKDIIAPDSFDEHTAVVPGVNASKNNGRGVNIHGSEGILTKNSVIRVPENTAAFIFNQSEIEEIVTEAGEYEYEGGQESVFTGDGVKGVINQTLSRTAFGGIPSENKRIVYVNLREIRDIKFGTKGALLYHDLYYGTDLEIFAYGAFSIKIIDPEKFIRNFVPANESYYSFDDKDVRGQILAELLQSFAVTLYSLSDQYRISQIRSQSKKIVNSIAADTENAGTWLGRFGFQIVNISIENIEFSAESKELVNQFSSKKMDIKAYDNLSQRTADVMAQQKIAQGIQDNGFGDAGGMMFAMGMAQGINPMNASQKQDMTFNDKIDALKKLKELLDAGILTEEEFNNKKAEIMDQI